MSFFSKIFGKSTRTKIAADLSVLKCDVHSHFIPGIDDGASTMEDSMNMLREFSAMGYKKVVTTPHIMSDAYRNTPEIILDGLVKVRVALKTANIPIEIDAAAEYYLDYDFEKMIEEKKVLAFGKPGPNATSGKYVLFELPFINPPDSLYSVIFKLITNGYKPVLAHPERYNFWHNDFKKYEELVEKGVLLQLNINSLTGHYGPAVKAIAERLIDQNMISLLGSDCHRMDHIALIKNVAVYEKSLHKLFESGKLLNATL
jgi:protein-tyrosine phosphatase